MTLRRLCVLDGLPPPDGGGVLLSGEAAHRVASVWRLRAGDILRVFDGAGREWVARLEGVTRGEVAATLLEAVAPLPEPALAVTLACAFPRGQRGDWIVEKTTELGVSRIVPLDAARAVLSPGDGRLDRWRRIAIEAAEQCGRATVPTIEAAPPDTACHLVADPTATGRLSEEARVALDAGAATLYVGPEGGWSDEERARFRDQGARFVTLGPRTLRVETAAVVGVAALLTAIEELGGA